MLAVRLTPRASADRVGGLWTDADGRPCLTASVTAPPDKGRANEALILLLARTLRTPRSNISLAAGETSRVKRLRIHDADAALAARIDELAGHGA